MNKKSPSFGAFKAIKKTLGKFPTPPRVLRLKFKRLKMDACSTATSIRLPTLKKKKQYTVGGLKDPELSLLKTKVNI
jgi:hypothetical protein